MGDHGRTLQNEHDDNIRKTKPNSNDFGETFGILRFNEKSLFDTIVGFTPHWDYKPTNANHAGSPDVYTSEKIINLRTMNKTH